MYVAMYSLRLRKNKTIETGSSVINIRVDNLRMYVHMHSVYTLILF